MKKNIELTKEEYAKNLQEFYEYFENGYAFEEFLKCYLEKIGLDEVAVTKRSHDGGIDLTAVRRGIGDLGGQDFINYCVQAKRYKPGSKVNIDSVRALRGVLPNGSVGIFMTTADFSKNIKKEFSEYKDRPVILIDGVTLVNSCIDNEIGFIFKPAFNKKSMDILVRKEKDAAPEKGKPSPSSTTELAEIAVEKQITANDIRARILSLPRIILNALPADAQTVEVSFNGAPFITLTVNKGRDYLGGVTEIYRKLGLLAEDKTITPAKALWTIKNGNIYISIV